LAKLSATLAETPDPISLAERVAQVAVEGFCDLCVVHLLDEIGGMLLAAALDRRTERCAEGAEAVTLALAANDGPLQLALRSGEVVRTEAASAHQLLTETQTRSLIAVPLSVGSINVGLLSLFERSRERPFGEREADVALVAGRHVSAALDHLRALERERHVAERLRFVSRVTDQLFRSLDKPGMLASLLSAIVSDFADGALAATLGSGELRLVAAAGTRTPREALDEQMGTRPFTDPIEAQLVAAIGERRPQVQAEMPLGATLLRPSLAELLGTPTPHAWIAVPMSLGESSRGAIICWSSERSYDSADLVLLEEIARRASLALEHAESFARERRLTQTLQQATLPSHLATVPGATLSAIYSPAAHEEQVGGDWYDTFDLDDHRILLTVGDVSGHGLPASIVMGKLRHALNVVGMYEENPSRILDVAEQIVMRRFPQAVATAFVAVLDLRAQTMRYANAGHPYPLVRKSDGTIRELGAAGGLPIGLRTLARAEPPCTASLAGVDLLVLYTDGIVEAQHDYAGGQRRLIETLGRDAIFFVRDAAAFVKTSCVDGEAPDDIAVLVLNFAASDRWSFSSEDPRAARAVRAAFFSRLWERDPGVDLDATKVIFGELIANVARHAPGPVDIGLAARDGAAVLHVVDRGSGYASAGISGASTFAEHGRGLWLIDRLGGKLSVEPLPHYGSHVSVQLPRRGS
jgi:GAF domain-containing protein